MALQMLPLMSIVAGFTLPQAGGSTKCAAADAAACQAPRHLLMREDLPRSTRLNRQAFNRRNMSIDERRALDAAMEERRKNRQIQLFAAAIVLAGLWGTALFGPR